MYVLHRALTRVAFFLSASGQLMQRLFRAVFAKHALFNLWIIVVIAVVTVSLWAAANRPVAEPPWPPQVAGMSFSPLRLGNDPAVGLYPTREEIEFDLQLLKGKVRSIRTYGVGGTLADIPDLAEPYGMTVTLGAWLTANPVQNDIEVANLIHIAKTHENVTRVIVGNEAILRGELKPEQVTYYVDRVRRMLKGIPVSTAEPWHVWVEYPELGQHVDFVAAHFLPYWEGVELEAALDHVVMGYGILDKQFPKLPILLAEVGWPSNGRTRHDSVASESHEAIFLRRFLARAGAEKYDYYLMEAFDQPWKAESEGAVGAYWGVYDVERNPKFAFTEPIVRIPEWHVLAAATVVIGVVCLTLLLVDSNFLRKRGRWFLAITANVVAAALVWMAYQYTNQYLTAMSVAVGVVLALGFLGIVLVLLAEAHEMAEASWVENRRRPFRPLGADVVRDAQHPKVSIHVPAYDEPAAMMLETLNALARLDYPNFEVLVIDNNTKDPAVWQPVETHCQALGPRFRFFHVDPLQGFKAGALNFAHRHTAPDAEIIAVIDSDYQVSPRWLRDLVPHFSRPEIGVVQAPQDYRDGDENPFKAMCFAEYKGFFHIGMVTRNDRNAIIEHGTMTMIRTSVLKEVGGWGEWCITEDAELGLRILEHGYEAAYVPDSYGRGLIPDTFIDYKKQRLRWAYGAVQILRHHYREMLGLKRTRLTWGQRYHFLAGWLPWIGDGINLFYTLGALAWSVAIAFDPLHVDPPLAVFTVPPLALFGFKIAKMIYLYRTRMFASHAETASAAIAGLALSHTIAKAVVTGFFTKNKPFFRTPKCENRPAFLQALANSAEETAIALALWLAATAVAVLQGREIPGAILWSAALFVQSIPYVAAFLVSLTNAFPSQRQRSSVRPTTPWAMPSR